MKQKWIIFPFPYLKLCTEHGYILSPFSRVWLCNPLDCSPPDSSVHGISQARILEWVAISFSRGSSWPRDWTHVSWKPSALKGDSLPLSHQGSIYIYIYTHTHTHTYIYTHTERDIYMRVHIYSEVKSLIHVRPFATPWIVAHQAPRSMGYSRHEYWSGLLFPSPGDLPDPGIEPRSPAL